MKKAIPQIRRTSLFALLLLGLSAAVLSPGAATAQTPKIQEPTNGGRSPRLVVTESTYNWGKLLKGDTLEHKFTIRNEGDAPLLIEKVKAT